MEEAGATIIDQFYGVLTYDLLAARVFRAMTEAEKSCAGSQAPKGVRMDQ
jgi:hypothetical protein